MAYSTDGQRIFTGNGYGLANLWEAASGQELLTLRGHNTELTCAAFSPDGLRIVTAGWDQTAKVWTAATAQQAAAWQQEAGNDGLQMSK